FPTVPWWVRIAAEPASLLALLLASALLWRGDTLFALASSGALQVGSWLARALTAPLPSPEPGAVSAVMLHPHALTAVALGVAPLVFMASSAIYRWSAEMIARPRMR